MDRPFPSKRWREEAEILRRHGAVEAAATKDLCADDLDAYEKERVLEALTLTQAAAESGYSSDHLARMIGQGRLENVGEDHAPRLARGSLPKKPPKAQKAEPDLVGAVRRATIGREVRSL